MTHAEFASTKFHSGMTFIVDGVEMPLDAVDFGGRGMIGTNRHNDTLSGDYVDESSRWFYSKRCTIKEG